MSLRDLAFHPSGKPRGWVRTLLFRKDRTARPWARPIVTRRDGTLRGSLQPWSERLRPVRSAAQMQRWAEDKERLIRAGGLAAVRRVDVLTSPHCAYLGDRIAAVLRMAGFDAQVVPGYRDEGADLYVLIAPPFFEVLPPLNKTVVVQVEQTTSDRWTDDAYLDLLQSCLAVVDYSIDNILYLLDKGFGLGDLFYVPILPDPGYAAGLAEARKTSDILFYGNTASPRRQAILAQLRDHAAQRGYRLRVENRLFGAQMTQAVREARLVLNLHFYDDALLETNRIAECLALGTPVLSEDSRDSGDFTPGINGLHLVPTGDGDALMAALDRLLAGDLAVDVGAAADRLRFAVLRLCLGLGMIDFARFDALTRDIAAPADAVLTLPEDPRRYRAAMAGLRDGARPFWGLRARPGWVGCALSYKYLARRAMAAGDAAITVYEDDALFRPDHDRMRATIDAYLARPDVEWHAFSGLISDLPASAQVLRVDEVDGVTFVSFDRMVGLVYGRYRGPVLETMAAWAQQSDDYTRHAIDRVLEAHPGLRVVTTIPPLVGHDETHFSTLWQAHNIEQVDMVNKSAAAIAAKVAEFRRRPAAPPR